MISAFKAVSYTAIQHCDWLTSLFVPHLAIDNKFAI